MLSALSIVHPLHSLPSLLALEDLREHLPDRSKADPGQLGDFLRADPLSAFRALRLTCAPHLNRNPTQPLTIETVVRRLGPALCEKVFDVPPVDPDRTRKVRQLWLHTLATACAARQEALDHTDRDPEVDYLAALVAGRESWLRMLALHHNGGEPGLSGDDWTKRWHLRMAPTLSQAALSRARATAIEAGFPADGPCEPISCPLTDDVRETLAAIGLQIEQIAEPGRSSTSGAEAMMFGGGQESTSVADVAALARAVITCREAHTVREALRVALYASLNHLDFDRAFLVTASQDLRNAWIRARADLSPVPFRRVGVKVQDQEAVALHRAATDGSAELLVREGSSGLTTMLGTDRGLVASVGQTRNGQQRFVFVDRAVTCRTLDRDRDGAQVVALGALLSLLVDNLELRRRRRRAEVDARTDVLTGLANRRAGVQDLRKEIARSRRSLAPLSVMMLDLDEFKQLNDTYGHQIGDQALKLTARVLRRECRRTDTICRFGGEEFLVALPETSTEEAMVLATRLFIQIEQAGKTSDIPLTVSIGLSALRDDDDQESLIARADHALYASKTRGRNRLSIDV